MTATLVAALRKIRDLQSPNNAYVEMEDMREIAASALAEYEAAVATPSDYSELVKDLREFYAHMFAEMATYAPDCIERAADAVEQQGRDLAAARRECTEMRERTIEECADFIKARADNQPLGSPSQALLLAIETLMRALAKPEHKEDGEPQRNAYRRRSQE